jgi:hypothetical protein
METVEVRYTLNARCPLAGRYSRFPSVFKLEKLSPHLAGIPSVPSVLAASIPLPRAGPSRCEVG